MLCLCVRACARGCVCKRAREYKYVFLRDGKRNTADVHTPFLFQNHLE